MDPWTWVFFAILIVSPFIWMAVDRPPEAKRHEDILLVFGWDQKRSLPNHSCTVFRIWCAEDFEEVDWTKIADRRVYAFFGVSWQEGWSKEEMANLLVQLVIYDVAWYHFRDHGEGRRIR